MQPFKMPVPVGGGRNRYALPLHVAVSCVAEPGPQISATAFQLSLFGPGLTASITSGHAAASPARHSPDYVPCMDRLARGVGERLTRREPITWRMLFELADEAFGGTQAQGTYRVKDAYDAMELAACRWLLRAGISSGDSEKQKANVEAVQELIQLLPTQTKRTGEQQAYQQFSTPLHYALALTYIAGVRAEDVVLEPSAGTGSLVTTALAVGAGQVIANELSGRRAAILRLLADSADSRFSDVHLLDALYLNALLPQEVQPSLILMNPPFSSDGEGRKKRNTTGAEHIEEALRRLVAGGRLVAVVGRGMTLEARTFRDWWQRIQEQYAVRANIGVSGQAYAKYGTSFETRVLVIDKTGPHEGSVTTGEVDAPAELIDLLADVQASRPPVEAAKVKAPKQKEQRRKATLHSGDGQAGQTPAISVPKARPATPKEAAKAVRLVPRFKARPPAAGALSESVFEGYEPSAVIEGSQIHPSPLVESAAMATVDPPKPTYWPLLPLELVHSGRLSSAQLEAVIYAGQAHEQRLPDGSRKGFFIGDGTGVGKGTEVAGVILDNFDQGRRKAVWITEKADLLRDARRDWKWIGQDPAQVVRQNRFKDEITLNEGILFTTYATLRSKPQQKNGEKPRPSRLEQITRWLGKDFDGVIVFDESHNMANLLSQRGKRGSRKGSLAAQAGRDLQAALPNARIVYVSATGATEVANLAYARRLGLWGETTPFTDASDFVSKVAAGGIAAMELVARDMKALGLYVARSLSYAEVEYAEVLHELTPEQKSIYDRLAEAWQIVLQNVNTALEATGGAKDGHAKSVALSRFWGAHQRFFNQVITSMQVPSLIRDMKAERTKGNSTVLQIVNTNEAATERALARAEKAGICLDDLDITPREMLLEYVAAAFPTTQYEMYLDEDGEERTRPLKDADGNPVANPEAEAMRDELLIELGSIQVPRGALDQIIDYFGPDQVAEITGRSRRFVTVTDEEGRQEVKEEKITDHTRSADLAAFNAGKKRILIFSDKGGTGASYHADRRIKNSERRVHYLVQPGWRADKAVQGFGRTHRSNQTSAPLYKLVTTDLKAQRRFLSSIARRLDQLGALTKGQRQTGSQGVLSAEYNLETPLARTALVNLLWDVAQGREPMVSVEMIEEGMGLRLLDGEGNICVDRLPDIPRFLNRLLSLTTSDMNTVFDAFAERLERATEYARQNGTLDVGVENLMALSIRKQEDRTVYTHPLTGAQTGLVTLDVTQETQSVSFAESRKYAARQGFQGYFQQKNSGRVYAIIETGTSTHSDGRIQKRYRRIGPKAYDLFDGRHELNKYRDLSKAMAEALWEAEYRNIPDTYTERVHLLTGTILPVWDRLGDAQPRIYRVQTDEGERLLGRVIPPSEVQTVLKRLGASGRKIDLSPVEAVEMLLNQHEAGKPVTLELSNGWRLRVVRLSADWRIEILGVEPEFRKQLRESGVIVELVSFKTRYFIPTALIPMENGAPSGPEVFARVTAGREVVDIL